MTKYELEAFINKSGLFELAWRDDSDEATRQKDILVSQILEYQKQHYKVDPKHFEE